MFGGREMVAIEDAGTVAGQPRGTPGGEFVDDAGRFLGSLSATKAAEMPNSIAWSLS